MKAKRLSNKHKIFITVKTLTSSFAKHAIEQSPYRVPENLEIAVGKFHARIEESFADLLKFNNKWLDGKISEKEYRKRIYDIIKDPGFVEVAKWNERKNGNKAAIRFSSIYDSDDGDPDDNFIDLDALSRNIEMETWKEAVMETQPEDLAEYQLTRATKQE